MILPNFLIIGAQKSGTSWLHKQLSTHPEVFMAEKELHFFDKAYHYFKGIEWYRSHFSKVKGEAAIGEKTPDYLWANGIGAEGHLPSVHKNISRHLPNAKLIIILRNPVFRAISAAKHLIRSGRISPLHRIDDLLFRDYHLIKGHGILEYGYYADQLKAYFKLFPREQILILSFEEAMADKTACLQQVCSFLGISDEVSFPKINEKINTHDMDFYGLILKYYCFPLHPIYMRVLKPFSACPYSLRYIPSQDTICKLYELYQPFNLQLFQLLGKVFKGWGLEETIVLK